MRRSGLASSADRAAVVSGSRPARDARDALQDLKRRLAALQPRLAGSDATFRGEGDCARGETEPSYGHDAAAMEQGSESSPGEGGTTPARADSGSRPDPYRQALGLLVRREHSRTELERKLRARGADPDAAALALQTLKEQGYQDDTRFAEMLVRTRVGGGYGPLRIQAELGTHGIDADTVRKVLVEAAPDWVQLALVALQRRYGGRAPRDRAEQLKRGQFLQRRGFDADSIRQALEATRLA